MGLVRAHSERVAQRRRARPCRVLLVDETSIRRRHRYVTVVACGDSGKVLAMIPGRTKGSLARFFRDQGPQWCRQVEIVVSDGSRSYQAAIAQYLPAARHVLDRFHVVRWFTQGLTLVRREIQRRDPQRRPPTFEPDLFRARFTLLRRADHLTEAHQAHLDRLFDAHPRLRTAWDALQELYQLYEADDPDQANQALGRFADLYATGQTPRIPPSRGHHHRMGRTDLGLPHHPTTGIQRTHRRDQQPPTSPTTRRPRVHQPQQLRRPRNPRNMTPHRALAQPKPTFSRSLDFLVRLARTPKKTRTSRLIRVNNALRIAVPQLDNLSLERDEDGKPHLEARYKHWRVSGAKQNERDFSDGTLRLIGLLWLIQEPAGKAGRVILLEEPELSLHTAIVRQLPAILHRAARRSGAQIILSTHSTELLGDPGLGLDEVVLLQPGDEGTTAIPATAIPDVEVLLEAGTTGRNPRTENGATSGGAARPLLMLYVRYAVEGPTDEPVAEKLLNRTAKSLAWLVMRDLDRDDKDHCVPALHAKLLNGPTNPGMCFRLVVRATEAWLMADRDAFADYFAVRRRLPDLVDEIGDPKQELINLCRNSRKKDIREGVVPRPASGRRVGPEYAAIVGEFGRETWDPERARVCSPSLDRALMCLVRLRAWLDEQSPIDVDRVDPVGCRAGS